MYNDMIRVLLFLLSPFYVLILAYIHERVFWQKARESNNQKYIKQIRLFIYFGTVTYLSLLIILLILFFSFLSASSFQGIVFLFPGIVGFSLWSYASYLSFKYGINTETKTYRFSKPYVIGQIKGFLAEKQIEFTELKRNRLSLPSKNVTITCTGMIQKFTHVIIGEYIGLNKEWIDSLVGDFKKILGNNKNAPVTPLPPGEPSRANREKAS